MEIHEIQICENPRISYKKFAEFPEFHIKICGKPRISYYDFEEVLKLLFLLSLICWQKRRFGAKYVVSSFKTIDFDDLLRKIINKSGNQGK